MKKIRYKMQGYHEVFNEQTGRTDKLDGWVTVTAEDTPEERQIAEEKAYDGAFEPFDDGLEEAAPSRLDILEAQVAYTAMMTDTLTEV